MAHTESPGVPFAIPDAPAPAVGWHLVNGCRLYGEVRGAGPPLLIIGAASDDAEMFRPLAERLAGSDGVPGFTVVTCDPRGTLRSSRDGWPCDSYTHADDAAALLRALRLAPAAIFGASAGGIVAVRLAIRHPELVRQVLVYEPGFFRSTGSGAALLARTADAVTEHLRENPGDWSGAEAAVTRVAALDPAVTPNHSDAPGLGLLDAPPGLEWYTDRGAALAENFIRDDLPRTGEHLDLGALRACDAELHFAFGTGSAPVFREISEMLTRARHAATPERRDSPDGETHRPHGISGAAHLAYLTPGPIADYVRARCLPEPPHD